MSDATEQSLQLSEARDFIDDLKPQKGTLVQRCFARATELGGDELDALRLCVMEFAELASRQNQLIYALRLRAIRKLANENAPPPNE